MSGLAEYITSYGINELSFYLLLATPVLLFLVNLYKYVIGIKTYIGYGIIALIFLFYFASGNNDIVGFEQFSIYAGWASGSILFGFVFGATYVFYISVRRIFLHYFPKVSIVVSSAVVSIILLTLLMNSLGYPHLYKLNPICIILAIIISEQSLTAIIRNGIRSSFKLALGSYLIALTCYLLLSLEAFENLLFAIPYISLLGIVGNFLIGKYTGLRISEYIRFYDILNEEEDLNEFTDDTQE